MLLLIYLLYQILATSQTVLTASIEPLLSAAKGNRTTLHTEISPPWVSSSNTRGTSDILWSCIVTLTACVYSALHLNIPPANEGKLKFYWRKLKWVAIALFAPEIVLYCALTQFLKARELVKVLNKLWTTQQAADNHNPKMDMVSFGTRTSKIEIEVYRSLCRLRSFPWITASSSSWEASLRTIWPDSRMTKLGGLDLLHVLFVDLLVMGPSLKSPRPQYQTRVKPTCLENA